MGTQTMFCYQCEQTAKGEGCTRGGVCGKDPDVAALQDLLVYAVQGLSQVAMEGRNVGVIDKQVNVFTVQALFATLTNVNFDKARFTEMINRAVAIRDRLPPSGNTEPDACTWKPKGDYDILEKAKSVGILSTGNEDVRSLRSTLLFGLKGISAYYTHAAVLGKTDAVITTFLQKGLASMLRDLPLPDMIALVMECGSTGVRVLALLDEANTSAYGKPQITSVKTTVGKRPGILITGHDLKDLEMLLEQSKDAGVDVYTHGEMLPAHAYPAFKKYSHLVGNYGSSWWHQKEEFEQFNGPVLFTTNCLVPPKDTYKGRLFTTGLTGFSGVPNIEAGPGGKKDFSKIIALAKTCQPPNALPGSGSDLITGCAHDAVLALADTVVGAVKSGAIKRFIVMAGCDGRQKEREYYTAFAKALPKDTVILTAGCAKYRYNSLGLGTIGGIPRVLDAGQCNDCYSLVVIAQALAKAFGVGINELPISYNIAWYEQKAVLVLLALLHLGVKDITLGPKLPAFVSPAVLDVLVKNFDLKPNTTVEADMARMLKA